MLDKSGISLRSEFIGEAVRHYLNTLGETRIIKITKLSKGQAKKEIVQFLKDRKEADTFDIANAPRLDIDVTVKALKELWKESMLKGRVYDILEGEKRIIECGRDRASVLMKKP